MVILKKNKTGERVGGLKEKQKNMEMEEPRVNGSTNIEILEGRYGVLEVYYVWGWEHKQSGLGWEMKGWEYWKKTTWNDVVHFKVR